MHTTTRTLTVVLGLALLAAGPAIAQQRAHLGLRGGYNFDREGPLIGAQMLIPIGRHVELYPSLNYHPEMDDDAIDGSMLGISVDLKFRSPGLEAPLYFGGGLHHGRASFEGVTNDDTGVDVFAGIESRSGEVHPFFEVRGLLGDESSVQIVGGLNMTL